MTAYATEETTPADASHLAERGVRQLELLVRLAVHALRGERNQKEMILLLDSIGFRVAEIMAALDLPRSTVAPAVSKFGGKSKRTKSPNGAKSKVARKR